MDAKARLPAAEFNPEGLKLHADVPRPFSAHMAKPGEEVKFDPKRHLQIEMPRSVVALDFKDVSYPYGRATKFPGLAYTKPFRLLSSEGVKALRSVVDSHKSKYLKQNNRNNCIRGLGYLSQFVRDFSYCPQVIEAFSSIANENLWPHNMTMNLGHTNFGEIGSGRAVDAWHVDSTDYVTVLILSDITDMKGGELQVLQLPDARGNTFARLQMTGIPRELVETSTYFQAGYCIFMQGSKILHSVTPVESAREPRISYVQSWSRRNVFAPDLTRFATFRHNFKDPSHVTDLEYARHKAWRVAGQMEYVRDKAQFGMKAKVLAKMFESSAKELLLARDLLLGAKDDRTGSLKNEKDTVTKKDLAAGRDISTDEKELQSRL